MLYISDDELALCISESDHELAPYNSHHDSELLLYVWGYRKRPDQGCYRERPDQSHSVTGRGQINSAAHSKMNQVKSAEKLLKALREGRIHKSGHF